MNKKYIIILLALSLLLPSIVNAESSMDVIQLGISGLITTPDIILEDIDNDGINSYENRSCWKHDDKSLKELYSNLGFEKIYCVLDDYIGVWEN